MKLPEGNEKFDIRVIQLCVSEKDSSIFDDSTILISIVDEAAGEFVEVKSLMDGLKEGVISFNPNEWPHIKKAVDYMVGQCRES